MPQFKNLCCFREYVFLDGNKGYGSWVKIMPKSFSFIHLGRDIHEINMPDKFSFISLVSFGGNIIITNIGSDILLS